MRGAGSPTPGMPQSGGFMKHIRLLTWAAVIVLGGLLLSTVLAVTGTYELAIWSISGGGGASTGGAYSLDDTIAQPIAGNLSGQSYTLETGFWELDDSGPVGHGFLYLPLIRKSQQPSVTPTTRPTS